MFSRAAKSIVKTIGQQKFHAGEENIKLAMVGGAGEIGRSLSQMLKQTSKLDVLALYDVAALNKRHAAHIKPKIFSNGQPNANSRMLTMLEKSRTSKGDYLPMHEKETGELVESLRRLPIAEECATSPAPRPAVGSQGDNAYGSKLGGPRVLAEMGPVIRDAGDDCVRIASEIRRHFSNFATQSRQNTIDGNVAAFARRQYSTLVLLPDGNRMQHADTHAFIAANAKSSRNVDKIAATLKNTGSMDKKNYLKKKDFGKKLNMISSEQIAEKKMTENFLITQKCNDKKKIRVKKFNDVKIVEDATSKIIGRSSNLGKPKNWTIPAALGDKKPKMLYGLVRQRRKPLANFFFRFLDVQEAIADRRNSNYTGCKIDKLYVRNQNQIKPIGVTSQKKFGTKLPEERMNVTTSVTDLPPETIENVNAPGDDNSNLLETFTGTGNPISVEQSSTGNSEMSVGRTTSSYESENERMSNESLSTVQKVSSKIAQFLETLKSNRRRSSSTTSLVSYNLDTLFATEEMAPAFDGILVEPSDRSKDIVLFGKKKDPPAESQGKQIYGQTICKEDDKKKDKKEKKKPPPCKERQDDCKKREPKCKKREKCKKPDPCKKDPPKRDPCKKDTTKKERPKCKPRRTEKCGKPEQPAKCPPVVRAPGCKDSGKPGKGCKKYSTLAFHMDYKSVFSVDNIKNILNRSMIKRERINN